MAKRHIEPKPTTYRGFTFRSRLEARWAVFLDNHPAIGGWSYEPGTFRFRNGWEYTPDFLVTYQKDLPVLPPQQQIYLEVKPTDISTEYAEVLSQMMEAISEDTGIPVVVVVGDYFALRFKLLNMIGQVHRVFGDYFPNAGKALQIAAQHRFDLVDRN